MNMAMSDNDEELPASGVHTHIRTDDQWSPACTHMSTSDDQYSHRVRGQDFLADLSDEESIPQFLLDSTKIHVDGSEIRGRAGFGVFFPHAGYDNISEPVVGPQTNNREGCQQSEQDSALCATTKSCACMVIPSGV